MQYQQSCASESPKEKLDIFREETVDFPGSSASDFSEHSGSSHTSCETIAKRWSRMEISLKSLPLQVCKIKAVSLHVKVHDIYSPENN